MINRITQGYEHVPRFLARSEAELERGLPAEGEYKGCIGLKSLERKQVKVIYIPRDEKNLVTILGDILDSVVVTHKHHQCSGIEPSFNVITLFLRKAGRIDFLDGDEEDLQRATVTKGLIKRVSKLE